MCNNVLSFCLANRDAQPAFRRYSTSPLALFFYRPPTHNPSTWTLHLHPFSFFSS